MVLFDVITGDCGCQRAYAHASFGVGRDLGIDLDFGLYDTCTWVVRSRNLSFGPCVTPTLAAVICSRSLGHLPGSLHSVFLDFAVSCCGKQLLSIFPAVFSTTPFLSRRHNIPVLMATAPAPNEMPFFSSH